MCLYFTRINKDGRYDAVYNGRFAFAVGVNHSEAESFVKQNLERENYEALYEEFKHSQFFMSCKTGLALNGARWVTRLLWLITGNKYTVEKYYELRTIFYAHMYELHEKAVVELNIDYLPELEARDKLVISNWKTHLPKSIYCLLYLFFPLFTLMGRFASKDFTIVSQQPNCEGLVKERNFSRGGIFNDIGSNPNRAIDNALKYLQIERLFKKSNQNDLEWFACKFRAEKRLWNVVESNIKSNNKLASAYPNFESYAFRSILFSFNWSLSEKMEYLTKLLLFSLHPDDLKYYHQLLAIDDSRLKKSINFFYLHGN